MKKKHLLTSLQQLVTVQGVPGTLCLHVPLLPLLLLLLVHAFCTAAYDMHSPENACMHSLCTACARTIVNINCINFWLYVRTGTLS